MSNELYTRISKLENDLRQMISENKVRKLQNEFKKTTNQLTSNLLKEIKKTNNLELKLKALEVKIEKLINTKTKK